MSDDNNFLGTDGRGRLTADITYLMLKGGGYALVLCLSIWLVIAVIAAIGGALPEDSQFQADPNLRGSVMIDPALVEYT